MFKGVGKGAIILILSGFVCKFLGAFFRLPLTSILGIEGIGVFQMIMSLYSLALVFVTGGVTNALSQLISSARARGEHKKIGDYFKSAFFLTIGVASVLSLAIFFLSRPISHVQGVDAGALSYKLFIVLLPLGACIGVLRGVIQGYENMTPTAISQILEQVFKLLFGLLLAYIFARKGIESGVFGGFLGIALSEVIAFGYLAIYTLKKVTFARPVEKGNFPVLLSAVVPLSLSSAVLPLTHAVDSLLIVSRLMKAGFSRKLATSLFGLQTGVVGAILNFPLIISLSIAMTLLPKISFLTSSHNEDKQKDIISLAFLAMWASILPFLLGIMAVSGNIYKFLYPKTIAPHLETAIQLTILGGFSILLTAIMQFLLSLLHAKGFFVYSFLATLFGGIAKVFLVYFLAATSQVNIFAVPISNIAMAFIVCVMAIFKLGGLVALNTFNLFVPLLASTVMYMLIRLISFLNVSNLIILLLSVLLGCICYVVLAFPVLKTIFLAFFDKSQKNHSK